MKALLYLMLRQLKNKIVYLRKKPGMMILYIIILLSVIGSVVLAVFSGEQSNSQQLANHYIIFLFINGFGLLYLLSFTYTGLSTGSTFFTMADVGLLFVAPISTKKVLIYGLLKSIGKTSLTSSLFIIYNTFNLKTSFGYSYIEILALLLIYILMEMFCHILSIGIYIFTNGNQSRKNLIKGIFCGIIAIVILALYAISRREEVSLLEALKLLLDRKWYGYIPVMGWATMFFKGVLSGITMDIVISLGFFILTSIVLIRLLTVKEADYYEDVLYSTELTFKRIKDAKEGRNVSTNTNRKINIKEENHGLHKGKGAMTFVYKHLLEMKRSSRFIFIDGNSIFIAISVGIASKFIEHNTVSIYITLGTLIYMQYFTTTFGRLKTELLKPYIYMIPESSFKKILAASASSIFKPCVDSILIFGIMAVVGGVDILQCIFMALAYSASGFLFVGLSVVYQRLLNEQPNKIAQVFIGIYLLILVLAPGVAASVLITVYVLPESLIFLSTLPYTIVSMIIAFIMFFACRNLLDRSDYSERI